jgi:hypothetical protein
VLTPIDPTVDDRASNFHHGRKVSVVHEGVEMILLARSPCVEVKMVEKLHFVKVVGRVSYSAKRSRGPRVTPCLYHLSFIRAVLYDLQGVN